jgi:hypothetical protein
VLHASVDITFNPFISTGVKQVLACEEHPCITEQTKGNHQSMSYDRQRFAGIGMVMT